MGHYSDYINSLPEDSGRRPQEKIVHSRKEANEELAKLGQGGAYLSVEGGPRPGLMGKTFYEIRIRGTAMKSQEDVVTWCHFLQEVITNALSGTGNGDVKTIWVKPPEDQEPQKEEEK